MIDDVINRLASLGYTVIASDSWLLNFLIQKVTDQIKNYCNISELPNRIHSIAVDIVCGQFLYERKANLDTSLSFFNLESAVKQISEGDTSITYAIGDGNSTPEMRLDTLINYLINHGKNELESYRCLKW